MTNKATNSTIMNAKNPKYSREEIEYFWVEGYTNRQIAEIMGCSRELVRSWIKGSGAWPNPPRPRSADNFNERAAERLFQKGMKARKVSEILDCSEHVVRRWLRGWDGSVRQVSLDDLDEKDLVQKKDLKEKDLEEKDLEEKDLEEKDLEEKDLDGDSMVFEQDGRRIEILNDRVLVDGELFAKNDGVKLVADLKDADWSQMLEDFRKDKESQLVEKPEREVAWRRRVMVERLEYLESYFKAVLDKGQSPDLELMQEYVRLGEKVANN